MMKEENRRTRRKGRKGRTRAGKKQKDNINIFKCFVISVIFTLQKIIGYKINLTFNCRLLEFQTVNCTNKCVNRCEVKITDP